MIAKYLEGIAWDEFVKFLVIKYLR
jgi:hypothetical protein